MNIEKLKIVRDVIANAKPKRFSMSAFFQDAVHELINGVTAGDAAKSCGTAMCFGGWVVATFEPDFNLNRAVANIPETARMHLELTADEADHLFLGEFDPRELRDITKEQGLCVLDHAIATGEIKWGVNASLKWIDETFAEDFED